MTTALHPDQTFEFRPDGFDALPDDQRPVITCRVMSCWYWVQLADALTRSGATATPYVTALADELARTVVGWRGVVDRSTGVTIPYEGAESILRAVSPGELMRWAIVLPSEATLREIEKKVSPSPSRSNAEGSAASAATAAA